MSILQFDVEQRAGGARIYARVDKQVVGAIDLDHVQGRTEVAVIYVVPAWRGRGIAKALLDYAAGHVFQNSSIGVFRVGM
jgi:ribosomal protein S18 acetylase RimI-like enzyme